MFVLLVFRQTFFLSFFVNAKFLANERWKKEISIKYRDLINRVRYFIFIHIVRWLKSKQQFKKKIYNNFIHVLKTKLTKNNNNNNVTRTYE